VRQLAAGGIGGRRYAAFAKTCTKCY